MSKQNKSSSPKYFCCSHDERTRNQSNERQDKSCLFSFVYIPSSTKNNSLRGCLCRQRTKIPLRLKINSDLENRNLRTAWMQVSLPPCMQSNVSVYGFSTISQHYIQDNGGPTEDSVSLHLTPSPKYTVITS